MFYRSSSKWFSNPVSLCVIFRDGLYLKVSRLPKIARANIRILGGAETRAIILFPGGHLLIN